MEISMKIRSIWPRRYKFTTLKLLRLYVKLLMEEMLYNIVISYYIYTAHDDGSGDVLLYKS